MAAGLIRHRLTERGVTARVLSAGILFDGREASGNGVRAMARRGIDIGDHRSQKLSPGLVAGAHLIVGMERQHVREVAVTDPDAFARAFTLPELARRARELGPRRPDEDPADWVRRAGAGRRTSDLLREDPADEVADPYGLSARRYEATAAELEGLVTTVVDHLFPV